MSLQTDLVQAGIQISHYHSDLYFPVTEESTKILRRHHPNPTVLVSTFTNQVEGGFWYSVFAAYDDYNPKKY